MAQIRGLTDQERMAWLRLIRSENVGVRTFHDMLKLYGSPERALEAIPDLAYKGGRKRPITVASHEQAEQELARCKQEGARIIAYPEPYYPKLLREIASPPPVLTVKGDPSILNKKTIAMVGARNASVNGCRFAQHIASQLSEAGFIVVSGLARGIDRFAHRGSVEHGTIGVIAGGIDHVYPKENQDLYDAIPNKGAIVAELPIGAVPVGRNFPQRNRIISGMSLGTLVVEASERSGSLITARYALEQNRDIFAVPGSPFDQRCRGTNQLIKNGAIMVETVEDIIHSVQHFDPLISHDGVFEAGADYTKSSQRKTDDVVFETIRKEVINTLSSTPVGVDELVMHTGLAVEQIITVLVELELAGRLERHPGNRVSMVFDQESLELT
ncbi:MAG: DNA-processing protein DprA [Rickettsiales bacterium]|nr:DNA-processing protein DprA [Rickettsiales bacterium]